jgi:hypothetical protein
MPETAQPKRTKDPSYFVLVEKIGTDPQEQRRAGWIPRVHLRARG